MDAERPRDVRRLDVASRFPHVKILIPARIFSLPFKIQSQKLRKGVKNDCLILLFSEVDLYV